MFVWFSKVWNKLKTRSNKSHHIESTTKSVEEKKETKYVIIKTDIEGDLISKDAHIVIQKGSVIKGDITGKVIDIHSKVCGNILAYETVILQKNSFVNGNIHTQKIVIKEGATGDFQIRTGYERLNKDQIIESNVKIENKVQELVNKENSITENQKSSDEQTSFWG